MVTGLRIDSQIDLTQMICMTAITGNDQGGPGPSKPKTLRGVGKHDPFLITGWDMCV